MTARRTLAALLCLLALTQVTWASHAAPQSPAVKGLAQLNWSTAALGDRALLGVESWYAWGMGACSNPATWPACVPMNRNWDLAVQTYCPPHMLLGNEPTNPEPGGHLIAASVAASVTVAIEAACPDTALVAANIHLNNCCGSGPVQAALDWLTDYLAAYQQLTGQTFAHTLGIHCYAQWADTCFERIAAAMPLHGGDWWLTEFALFGAYPYVNSGAELSKFLTVAPVMFPRIRAYYVWTNRSDPACCSGWPFELVNGDGTLTPMGQAYAAWSPPAVTQHWFPAVGGPPPGGYP